MIGLIRYLTVILSIGQALGQKTENIRLIEFAQSACDRTSDPYRIRPRIVSLEQSGDTLLIEVGFAATCCLDYTPVISYSADTLYISYTADGVECSCICCYSFNHKIKGVNSSKLTVKLDDTIIEVSDEKYRTYTPTYVIVKGDTLNRTDKYGLKQGIWIDQKAIQKIEGDTLIQKSYSLEQITWANQSVAFFRYTDENFFTWGRLYLNLRVKEEYNARTGLRQEFYRSGKIRRECHQAVGGDLKDCRQWDRNGHEIKK